MVSDNKMSNPKRRSAWWPLKKNKNIAEPNSTSSPTKLVDTPSLLSPRSCTPRSNISLEELEITASPATDDERAANASFSYEKKGPKPASSPAADNPSSARTLWEIAFDQLREERATLVSEYEKLLLKEISDSAALATSPDIAPTEAIFDRRRQDYLKWIIDKGLKRMQENTWHFKIAGEEYTVKEQVAKAAKFALKAKDFIAEAVRVSPEASTALAGICIILPLFTNITTVDEANSSGLTYVISRMRFYVGLEELRWPKQGSLQDDLRAYLEEALISLYHSIIAFQVQSALRFYSNHVKTLLCDITNWYDWEGMIKTIKTKEDEVRQQFTDLDNTIIRGSLEKLSTQAALNYQIMKDQVDIMTQQLKTAEAHLEVTKTGNRILEDLSGRIDQALHLIPTEREPLDIKSALQLQFPPNKEFVGRQEQIKRLRKILTESTDYEIAALFGLGGMGKSQVALQLAHEVQRESRDYAVVWMSALSLETFEKGCIEVLKTLRIAHTKSDDAKDVWKRYIISQRDQQWLLIVDNADDLVVLYGSDEKTSGIFHFLPRTLNVRILVTTRFRKIATMLAQRNIVELLQMTPDEANTFLKKAMDVEKSPDDEDELDSDHERDNEEARKELITNLTYLPLALSQAIGYMMANDVTIREYLHIFNKADGNMIDWLKNGLGDEDYSKSQDAVATTWIISFDQIQSKEPVTASILLFLAWIEPKNIPISLLNTLGSEQEVAKALGTLCGYGFLRKHSKGKMVDMHRLVQLAAQLWIQERREKNPLVCDHASHLVKTFPADRWDNRALWREYVPHAKKLLEHTPKDDVSAVNLSYCLARCIIAEGRVYDSLDLFKYIVERRKQTLSDDDTSLLDAQHLLAIAYSANHQIKDAIALMEHVAKMRESYADDNTYRLLSQQELGNMYILDDRPGDAIAILEKVIAIQAKSLPKDDPTCLIVQEKLAKAYRTNGRIKEALAMQQYVTKIQNDTLVEDDPDRLISEHALALTYFKNDQVKEAIALWEPLVALATRTFTPNSPNVFTIQRGLAEAYYLNQQQKEAVAMLQIVVAGQTEIFAQDHPTLLGSQQALVNVYSIEDDFQEALALQTHVVSVKEKSLAANDPSLLTSQRSLSRYLIINGDVSGAVILLEKVVAFKSESLKEDEPELLSHQGELARAYLTNGDVKKGTALLEHVVAGFGRAGVDENHTGFRLARRWLAMVKEPADQLET